MSQQIRAAGGNQQLIDMVLGMSDEEWKKWKNSLFKFDNKGNITGLKRDAKNVQAALNAITLGNFQDSQKAVISGVSDQFRAVNKLISQGFSLKDAYEIVQDQALATAIAQERITKADFQKMKKDIEAANAAMRSFEATSRVVADIVQFDEQKQFEDMLKAGGYSEFQIEAIMSDDGLREMILAGEASAQAFADRLKQIVGSKEFLEATFNSGMSAVDEAFAVQEQDLRLQFEEDNRADFDIIEQAQRDMARLNYQLDDYQAALERMSEDEDAINEKYDERLDALDKIEEVNTRIAQRQRSQISVAEALSRGDISAAAKAIQELRAEQIKNSIEDRRKTLEASRERELNSLTQDANGQKRTRAEIEKLIRDTQREIFNIEEDSLEPAQRRIELAQEILDDDIEALNVLGKTRIEWDNIKNEVDLARINTESYVNQILAAVTAMTALKAIYESEWKDIKAPATPTPDAPIVVKPTPTVSDPPASSTTPSPRPPTSTGPTGPTTGTGPTGPTGPTAGSNTYPPIGRKGSYNGERVAHKGFWYLWMYGAWYKQEAVATTAPARGSASNPISPIWSPGMSLASQYNSISIPMGQHVKIPKGLFIQGVSDLGSSVRIGWGTIKTAYPATGKVVKVERGFDGKINVKPGSFAIGGMVNYKAMGGMFKSINTDSVPAMLTPGEFVVRRHAVNSFGVDNLKKINSGTYNGDSVYNYEVNVNVKSDANPDQIAQAVMGRMRQIESQRIRGGKL